MPVGELDQPGLIEVTGNPRALRLLAGTRDHLAGELDRQPRLADTAGAAEGQRAHFAQQPGQFGEIALTPDKAVRLRWQVAAEESGGGRHRPSGDVRRGRGGHVKSLTVPSCPRVRRSVAGPDI